VVIRVHALRKTYGPTVAVDDLSFEADKGEIVGFLGPNGAGKTTTMRILTCFMPASAGEATVCGFDISTDPLEVRRRVGYMPENAPLYDEMRVTEYLKYRGRLKGLRGARLRERLGFVLDRCGLSDVRGRITGQLSKGYRQRVGLAASMINDPEVLILDEPTIGLDPNQIREVRELIRELGQRRTIVLSTHILPEVEAVADRIIIINHGRLVAQDTPEGLARLRGKGPVLALEFSRGDVASIEQALDSLPGVAKVEWRHEDDVHFATVYAADLVDHREEIGRIIAGAHGAIRELATERMTLEEIFAHITSDREVQADA